MSNRPYRKIEFPSRGATYCEERYGVYEYGIYPPYSVLAGQSQRSFLGSFETLKEAQDEFPDAIWEEEDGSGFQPVVIPHEPPAWFDPADAGERWDDDY